MSQTLPPDRNTDKRKKGSHLFYAIRHSFDGLKVLGRETAFRHEIIFFLLTLLLLFTLNAAFHHYIIASVLFAILIAVEALNTAIEELVDELSPQWSAFAKRAKDLGSCAVMCLVIANGLFIFSLVVHYLDF